MDEFTFLKLTDQIYNLALNPRISVAGSALCFTTTELSTKKDSYYFYFSPTDDIAKAIQYSLNLTVPRDIELDVVDFKYFESDYIFNSCNIANINAHAIFLNAKSFNIETLTLAGIHCDVLKYCDMRTLPTKHGSRILIDGYSTIGVLDMRDSVNNGTEVLITLSDDVAIHTLDCSGVNFEYIDSYCFKFLLGRVEVLNMTGVHISEEKATDCFNKILDRYDELEDEYINDKPLRDPCNIKHLTITCDADSSLVRSYNKLNSKTKQIIKLKY